MIQASCSKCSATFDVTGKTPGTTLACPKCKQGVVTVPEPVDSLEELDPGLEVVREEEAPAAKSVEEPAEEPAAESGVPEPETLDAPEVARAPEAPKVPPIRPAGPARGRVRRARSEAPPARSGPSKAVLIVGAVVVVAAAAGAFFLFGRGGAGSGAGGGAGDGAVTLADISSLPPEAQVEKRREQLARGDLQGRLDLAEYCRENGLRLAQAELYREILLLDANNATAREAFDYRLYQGPAVPYQGLWLRPFDYALAVEAEALFDEESE